jgi:hypothetical protein
MSMMESYVKEVEKTVRNFLAIRITRLPTKRESQTTDPVFGEAKSIKDRVTSMARGSIDVTPFELRQHYRYATTRPGNGRQKTYR